MYTIRPDQFQQITFDKLYFGHSSQTLIPFQFSKVKSLFMRISIVPVSPQASFLLIG